MPPADSTQLTVDEWCNWTDRQALATATADAHGYTLYGGAKGPGKSYWLRKYLVRFLVYAYSTLGLRGVRVALFCEDYPSLNDRHLSKVRIEFPDWLGSYNATAHEFTLSPELGEGVLCFRNLDRPEKYKSAEFAAVAIDELTMNLQPTFDLLRGCKRWVGIEQTKFIAATNPDGVGHLWVKQLWLDREFPEELQPLAHEFAFVPALPSDNPYLSASYWAELRSLPPDLARAWVEGDWDVFQGQVFGEWRRGIHVVEPFEIPASWSKWRGLDWGYAQPLACLWVAKEPDTGARVVYRELYEKGLTDPEQAEAIRAMTPAGELIQMTLADPSMWTLRSLERQTLSSAQVYEREGIRLIRADNDRLIGLRRVRDALRVEPGTGRPGLYVFKTCANLIRTLPALPHDRVRVEDVDTDAEDHAYDALRYALGWKAWGDRRAPREHGDYWARVRHKKVRRGK